MRVLPSTPMPKYLQIGKDQPWELPGASDLDSIRDELKSALQAGTVASVPVLVKGVATELLVSGKSVAVCAVYEKPRPRAASF